MQRFLFAFLLVFTLSSPALAVRKTTVRELQETLLSLKDAKKSDQEVATRLKEIELSEQLTMDAKNRLLNDLPGPLSTEQIYVLEALSANLPPPAADLPITPAPDAAAQQAILVKAEHYVTRTYEQLPLLAATRSTLRFQDNVEAVAQSSGIVGSATEVDTSFGLSNTVSIVHFINSTDSIISSEHGAEKLPTETDKIPWGANRMIAIEAPAPSLSVIFREAQAAGTIQWLRWEMVNGRQAAVFSLAVPKSKSRLAVDICCFPSVTQIGTARFYTPTSAAQLGGSEAAPGGAGGVRGNMQTNTEWQPYKATAAYHGELFIDPETGIVVRMITEAELKPAEMVHRFDTRIDYGPVPVGAGMLVVPVKSIVNTVVVPRGDSGAGTYTTRRTLFSSEYKDYRLAGAH